MEHESEKTNSPLWIDSFLVACTLYVAIGLAFVFFYVPNSRAVGGAEAITVEFALEAQAPVVEEISEEVREETIAENEIVPEPEPKPESILEPEAEITPPTPPSDMVEEVKPEPELKTKGSDLATPKGQTFATPKTNRSFGNQSKAIAGWKTKVQQKIARSAKRFDNKVAVRLAATVNVFFRYDARGVITSATILRSSGNSFVDAIAVQAVQASSPIPAPPTGQAGSFSILVSVCDEGHCS